MPHMHTDLHIILARRNHRMKRIWWHTDSTDFEGLLARATTDVFKPQITQINADFYFRAA